MLITTEMITRLQIGLDESAFRTPRKDQVPYQPYPWLSLRADRYTEPEFR